MAYIFYDGIGERIMTLRRQMGISRDELAEMVGLSWTDLQMIEKDNAAPSEQAVDDLAKILSIDPYWLRYEKRK